MTAAVSGRVQDVDVVGFRVLVVSVLKCVIPNFSFYAGKKRSVLSR